MKKSSRNINRSLIAEIQPRGGITPRDEMYMKSGDGYSCCLTIMDYPQEDYDHWLNKICNIQNTVATVDISTDDVNAVKKNINRSMKEQKQRYESASQYTDESDAQAKWNEMKDLANELSGMNEVIKNITCRVFFSDRSLVDLEAKMKEDRKNLDTSGYKGYISINENKNDWESFYHSYTEQQKLPFSVEGQPVTANTLAGGNPFHFSSLDDPFGGFFGTTTVGGSVLWDLFYHDQIRTYYNAVVSGKLGSGKSTLLKKIFEDRAIRGDYVRTFDVSGEFKPLTEKYGGKIIKPDGSCDQMLNFLEILRAGDNETTNFSMHIAKVKTIYRYLSPEVTEDVLDILGILLRQLYERYNLTPEDEEGRPRQITGLKSTSYPILSDLVEQIEMQMHQYSEKDFTDLEKEVAKQEILKMNLIRNKCISLIENYGKIFNGYSSVDNILDEQIVTFDISILKEMDSHVFDAQFYNLLSLSWDNAVANGKVMLKKHTEKSIREEDIIHTVIILDESHRTINAAKEKALDQVIAYVREARKYFTSLIFASQSIRDYIPEGCSTMAVNKLKTLFELTQYKFVFNQGQSVLGHMEQVFGSTLTESQIQKIPLLEQGYCFMDIASYKTIEFKVYLTPEEERLFSGGA